MNFINIKLFIRGKPNILISKVIFGNIKLLRKNSTHDSSKILYHIIMFLKLLFRSIFPIKLISTSKPYLKSNTSMLLKIINNSKSCNDIIKLIISTHKPNNQTFPKIIKFLFSEFKVRLEIPTLFMMLVFPFRFYTFLENKQSINLLWPFLGIQRLEKTRILRIENCTKITIGCVFPKLNEFFKVGKRDNLFHVDRVIFDTHQFSVLFFISIVDIPFATKGVARELWLPLLLLFSLQRHY